MEFQNGSKGVKLELGTEKVIEMKQGSWKREWDEGEVKVGVPVQGCTECNTTLQMVKLLQLIWSIPFSNVWAVGIQHHEYCWLCEPSTFIFRQQRSSAFLSTLTVLLFSMFHNYVVVLSTESRGGSNRNGTTWRNTEKQSSGDR